MGDYPKAMAALEKAREYLDDDEAEAIEAFVSLFEPYEGDDAEEAVKRLPMTILECTNCGHRGEGMFVPAPVERAAKVSIRQAQCPRCYNTTLVMRNFRQPKQTG